MVKYHCPKCNGENTSAWMDIKRPLRSTCLKCGVVILFMAGTEEDLIRKAFKRKERRD
jgi:DNA-directed RNA polymerase subunit RPC12/RpoP